MKYFGLLLAVALLGGGGWWYATHRNASAAADDAGARPTTAPIETRDIQFSVAAAGEISPSDSVSVRPEVNGRIVKLAVDVGDTVKKGDLLFQLDDLELQAEKATQEKEVERAKLQLEQADRDNQRAIQMYKEQLISKQAFDDARTAFDLAKNAIDKNQRTLEQILERLKLTGVRAPFDCTVLTRAVSIGQAVSGSGGFNSGTEVMTVANLNDLIIDAHINQADVTRLKSGQEVDVTVEAVPGLKVIGKVIRVAPQATIKNNIKGFATRILLKDVDRRIRPGMTANITIPVSSASNVVSAPLASIFTELNTDTRQLERFAWVKAADGWERRPVSIGVSDYFFVEVTSGLKPGEIVSLEDRSKEAKKAPVTVASDTGAGSAGAKGPASTAAGASKPASTTGRNAL
jgi:HlyD family secretion protein